MKRAGFFDLLEEKKTQDFVDGVNQLVARWRFRPEAWDRSIGVRRAWLVLLLSAAILCRAFESGAATMEQPSASGSTPSTAVSPSPIPSAAEWIAEGQRYLDAKDFAKASALFQKAAADGQAAAMDNLGLLYRDGEGVAQDYGKAAEWFQKAADAGDADAMNHLGWLYDGGKGVAQDYANARRWYQKAADAGNRDGMTNLGVFYENGQGVALNYDKAREWYQKAAEAGNTNGMKDMGLLYDRGDGVTRDYDKAREWFQKAAEAKDSKAMNNLGVLYRHGQGVARDSSKAREWFQKAAEAQDSDAMAVIGINAQPQSNGKEECMVVDTGYSRDNAQDLQETLNKYPKQGWKVRAANEYLNDNHTLSMFVILYRESQ